MTTSGDASCVLDSCGANFFGPLRHVRRVWPPRVRQPVGDPVLVVRLQCDAMPRTHVRTCSRVLTAPRACVHAVPDCAAAAITLAPPTADAAAHADADAARTAPPPPPPSPPSPPPRPPPPPLLLYLSPAAHARASRVIAEVAAADVAAVDMCDVAAVVGPVDVPHRRCMHIECGNFSVICVGILRGVNANHPDVQYAQYSVARVTAVSTATGGAAAPRTPHAIVRRGWRYSFFDYSL